MDLWLRDYIRHSPEGATHFYPPTKSYIAIPVDKQEEFWTTYCKKVSEGSNPCICEVVKSDAPLQLGYNIRLCFERSHFPTQADDITELLESIDEYLCQLISVVQVVIKTYFEISEDGAQLYACYLSRPRASILVWEDFVVVFAARVVFPYAKVRRDYIPMLRNIVLGQLQIRGDTPDRFLSRAPINGLDTLIEAVDGPVLEMYGSTQSEEIQPFVLREIYGDLDGGARPTCALHKVFRPQLHVAFLARSYIEPSKYWLPLFFSTEYGDSVMRLRQGATLGLGAPKVTLEDVLEKGESISKLERARQLLNLLSHTRVEHYWSWYDIGQALHSIDSSAEGLKLWKWITVQTDSKTEQDCETAWENMDDSEHVDIETLEYFAYLDSKDKYEKYREPEITEAIVEAIHNPYEAQVAKAFKACFPHEFLCANFAQSEWYYYDRHRWVPMSGTSELMWYINEKFRAILEKKQVEISDKIAKSRDAETKSKNQALVTLLSQLLKKLSKNGFKKSLCEELKIYYRMETFGHVKDINPYYMSTPSGVIDLRGNVPCVRPGKPQDYITKQTRYPFPSNYTWAHDAVVMTMSYLRQVFRKKTLLEYVLRLGASLLRSGNSNKIFPIFSGEGNNSKSIFVRIIECAFGTYAVKLPTSLITEKRTSADAATPTLVHSQGAKVAFLQEPNAKESIQSGTVKELTGGVDTLYVRDLFQKGSKVVEMRVTIVPILIANRIPSIPDCQEAIWNRTRVIYFDSKWRTDAPEDPDEQFRTGVFKMDRFFDQNIPKMAPALLWIFVEKYKDYIERGLDDPDDVLEATEAFRVSNNVYIHFAKECTTEVVMPNGEVDVSAFVVLDDLFAAFRRWYRDQQFSARQPTKSEFKDNMQIVWRQKLDADNRWYGRRLNQASAIQSLLVF